MSGFLPDLANWALRGNADNGNNNNNNEDGGGGGDESAAAAAASGANAAATDNAGPALTPQEMRAQRLAGMEARQQQQAAEQAAAKAAKSAEAMDVDVDPPKLKPTPLAPAPAPPVVVTTTTPQQQQQQAEQKQSPKKKKAKAEPSPSDAARKLQRKKELLLKKILNISLAGTSTVQDVSCVVVDIDNDNATNTNSNSNTHSNTPTISAQTVAEILATRLSLSPSSSAADAAVLRTVPPPKPLVPYLAQCHRRAGEELKNIKQSSSSSNNSASNSNNNNNNANNSNNQENEIVEILEEIQRQVVSYAASCLMEPDLFELGRDAVSQLTKCLTSSLTDVTTSITFGVGGSAATSFYYLLTEELWQQDAAFLDRMVAAIVADLVTQLSKCESVLDGVEAAEGSPVVLVSAVTALCLHKRAADVVTKLPCFLLPAAGSPAAAQLVRPSVAGGGGGGGNIMAMLSGQSNPAYLKRSGPAIEKDTLLGLALRIGVPKNNAAFSPTSILRQSLDSVERATSQQRSQLKVHQEACNQLIVALVKAGPEARSSVMKWFIDALNVNVGASAMRPDATKVSSSNMLLNMSIVLLKLCEPFVDADKKQHLIDLGFVSSERDHGGVFETKGDNAVARLGESDEDVAMSDPYNPKNSFIPQCFFFCARALHFGIVPLLSYHENLLRHISHAHWDITQNGRDLQSDPHFSILVGKQRSNEVALYQEEMVADTLRFCNLTAKVLFQMDDNVLRTMPEDFVSDVCDIIMAIAKLKPKMLRGIQLGYVFKLVVKLLSAKYASMVRNYNLRAMLGDVLYELYLPGTPGDRREVPSSIASDPLAGGQTFLLSDTAAQETLAPSLLLLYGEVEHTGYYDKMSHRAKIASLIKYLWESAEHRPAFRRITQNKESFIKFANGIINETNTLIATVMQKLPEIKDAQEKMKNVPEWGRLSEDEQSQVSSRLDDNEREVKHALPLCNKTLQMFGYLSTDTDIRGLFLLEELCPRLVTMLLHVLTKLVGSKGLDLKVDNPDQYDFRPKEMLRDLCAIFALFASSADFQNECAKSGCDPGLLLSAVKTCRRLNLLEGESMSAFESLPALVEAAAQIVAADEALLADAPDEFLDEILSSFMKDPVILPSGHYVDRSTITQHLLNDSIDPFNREPMTIADVKPATELKERMNVWLEGKRSASMDSSS